MSEKTRKICCMFDYKDPDDAVRNKKLQRIENLWESSRREEYLCQCKNCGAYVVYDYEEIANLYGGWDNADIFERYYPVEIDEEDPVNEEGEYKWAFIKGAKWIYGHNLELDTTRRYLYRED